MHRVDSHVSFHVFIFYLVIFDLVIRNFGWFVLLNVLFGSQFGWLKTKDSRLVGSQFGWLNFDCSIQDQDLNIEFKRS